MFPDNATALVLSPDGKLGYVISNVAGSDESFIQVIDLENGGIVATSSNVPGHAGVSLGPGFSTEAVGTAVFDEAGEGYLTTWIRMPMAPTHSGVQPSLARPATMTVMSFDTLNVTYPEPEDTNPLMPDHFSSNSPGPKRASTSTRCYRSSARSSRKRFIPSIFSAREASRPA